MVLVEEEEPLECVLEKLIRLITFVRFPLRYREEGAVLKLAQKIEAKNKSQAVGYKN